MSRGFLIFAHNNAQVDYGLIAMINATMIKHFMPGSDVCLVTNDATLKWLRESRGDAAVKRAFDHIETTPRAIGPVQQRRFNDGATTQHMLDWFNHDRVDAYKLTPFDETILIDGDYLVSNDRLSLCWGNAAEVMINRHALGIDHQPLSVDEQRLSPTGIPMYWATCVYFRKSEAAETLFDLVRHAKNNYGFFRKVYDYRTSLYRNDYAFSVAIHMLNGYSQEAGLVPSLPTSTILTSLDQDDIAEVKGPGDFVMLTKKRDDQWSYRMTRVTGTSLHVLNKFTITRHADRLLALHGGDA